MKTIPSALIVASILAPLGSFAQTEGCPQLGAASDGTVKRTPQRPLVEGWKAADTNHDGFISKAEFDVMPRIQHLSEEKRQFLFNRLDKDRDGKLSREELGRIGKPHDESGPPKQRLWELDVDKSGGISFEEFKAGRLTRKLPPERQEELFRRLDTDHDGLITPKDKPELPFKHEGGVPRLKRGEGGKPESSRMEMRQLLRQLDQNQDGTLTLDEFRANPTVKDLTGAEQQTRFDALDRNHDQKLAMDDLAPPMPCESRPPEQLPPAPRAK